MICHSLEYTIKVHIVQENKNDSSKELSILDKIFIFGPCALESYEQMKSVLLSSPIKKPTIRAGVSKLRTSPDSFQGIGVEASITIINKLKDEFDFNFLTEITQIQEIEMLSSVADIFMVGTRNMYNYPLLKALNKSGKKIVLKRGMSATVDEWLNAAKYLKDCEVILCERGIRTFNKKTRNTLDIGSAIWLKQNTSYKVISDPSHASGISEMVKPLSLASIAAGLDGIIVECHPTPKLSLSDADQAISLEELNSIYKEMNNL